MNTKTRKAFYISAFVIAMVNLTMFFRSPDAEAIRTVNVLQLLASGALIGAATTGLIRSSRARS